MGLAGIASWCEKEELNKPANDGSHIIYVNCSFNGECRENLKKLIHDMKAAEAGEMQIEEFASLVGYYKTEGGVSAMHDKIDEFMQDYYNAGERTGELRGKQEGIDGMTSYLINTGKSDEEIISALINTCKISEEEALKSMERCLSVTEA